MLEHFNVNFDVSFNIFLEQPSCAFGWLDKRSDNSDCVFAKCGRTKGERRGRKFWVHNVCTRICRSFDQHEGLFEDEAVFRRVRKIAESNY